MKNTTTATNKNLPGTYKLVVSDWDGRGDYNTHLTKPLTIERAVTDETLIRKFVKAGLYHRRNSSCTIKRIK